MYSLRDRWFVVSRIKRGNRRGGIVLGEDNNGFSLGCVVFEVLGFGGWVVRFSKKWREGFGF